MGWEGTNYGLLIIVLFLFTKITIFLSPFLSRAEFEHSSKLNIGGVHVAFNFCAYVLNFSLLKSHQEVIQIGTMAWEGLGV